MIVAVCLELDGNNGSATQSRSRRRTSQAAAGPIIIRRAAGRNKAANATRAIIRRFLADRPRGEKARAADAIGGDAGLPAEHAARGWNLGRRCGVEFRERVPPASGAEKWSYFAPAASRTTCSASRM